MEITPTYFFLLSFFSLEEIVCVEIVKLKYFQKVLFFIHNYFFFFVENTTISLKGNLYFTDTQQCLMRYIHKKSLVICKMLFCEHGSYEKWLSSFIQKILNNVNEKFLIFICRCELSTKIAMEKPPVTALSL